MVRAKVARLALGLILLVLLAGCDTIGEYAVSLFSRRDLLTLPPYQPEVSQPGPGPWPLPTWTPPVLNALPGILPTPLGRPAPTPTMPPPTAEPSPTPEPAPTVPLPLDVLRKTPTPSTVVLGHGLTLPEGFKVEVYAQGLESVSFMAYGPGRVLFASLPGRGAVVAMKEQGDKPQVDQMVVFAQGLTVPTGLAFHDGYLYVAEATQVVRIPYSPRQLSTPGYAEVVVPNLPAGAGFKGHAIGFGPDDKLYVSVGASCNACREVDYRRATILRYDADGKNEELYAQGLRDVEDMVWYPNSGQLLATNCSRRLMGDSAPCDTIEYAFAGANLGWPFCHAGDTPDPDLGWPLACEGVPRPFQRLQAQTTPRGLCVYTGNQFPPEYKGDIFVAEYGSWERRVPVGYKIVRLDVEGGEVKAVEDFCTGWLVYSMAWGRPVDLVVAGDGSLLVSDDKAAAIYRIYHEGGA